jgi:hypothetical protein
VEKGVAVRMAGRGKNDTGKKRYRIKNAKCGIVRKNQGKSRKEKSPCTQTKNEKENYENERGAER